ncbi:MAG TPA: hypothetical protein VFE90_17940 [Myxococcales bacterium]|jgi:hypothetical protein|nr:hypothetical protein [Myxococcales bacterium]
MISITPCRATVSDRFPIASFVVHVPPDRLFEVACATDPLLFHPDQRARRRPENFVTSGSRGLLRAPAGEATYLMPTADLRRFAGAQRLYYALGAYRGVQHEDPVFTVAPRDPRVAPCIQLAPDFTGGNRLASARPPADARYGSSPVSCNWGGDATAAKPAAIPAAAYDDGFDPALWEKPEAERIEAPASAASELPRAAPVYGRGDAAAAEEPAGYEDAPHLRQAGGPPPPRIGGAPAEAQEFEDAPHLKRAGGRFGEVALPLHADLPPDFAGEPAADADRAAPAGRSSAYSNDYSAEDLPAEGEQPSEAISIAANAAERLQLIEVVAALESGPEGYSAVNPDGEYNDPGSPQYGRVHVGLSWGFVQFAQRYGALGQVLQACRRRDERKGSHFFDDVFGAESAEELLRVTNAPTEEQRLAPVGGLPLWDPAWVEKFRQAGRITIFQEAQREVADQLFLLPNLQLAGWLGLDTQRALAMLFDRCVQMGPGGGPSWILKVAGPIKSKPQRDAALAKLGLASLSEFKKSVGLPEDEQWGPAVHAALVSRMRPLGHESPVPVPSCAEIEELLVEAAQEAAEDGAREWQGSARRLSALAESDQLDDERLRVP